ncbi:helix-turn-helix domain-containing protein [Streptococcus sobrinus]|uniref:XRE family transcriptional regulator n=1 Tax=Streptococcus sobrinus TaxID=1310 RepID=A0ABM6W6G3_9STRE|nr:helix-turn-helix transcriptional regulator [Streptococcus sobrinus]AWN18555.1 XRE family transcriptional regulator [Streptococcus sobrinus]AWN21139.1 XRE family transcriptional regulator [Streptococcus sobrinus]EMP72018.1 XRE family transcriptional regulator [Streptococcus sobrinus DSM 20742 = ATCC 33478]OZV23236.1 XRE family transcriptional regulator [Streptococcus sobrinus]SQG13930.1 putative transcriptional regulator [Streptococcus sobrinus]
MEIGKRLKQARINAGLTQEEVSKKLFITRQTVSRWEQEKNLPNIYVLKDLSQLYKVEVAYFLLDTSQVKKQINFYALFGVICFNVFFVSFAYLVMSVFLFMSWFMSIFFVFLPLITALLDLRTSSQVQLQIIIAGKEFNPGHPYFNSTLFALIGLILLPLLFLLTRKIWRLTKQYVRYNIKNIYKDVH